MCNACSGKFGGKHFDAKQLQNHNLRGDRLQCKNCSKKKQQLLRQDADREKRIREKLKTKAALRCSCKKEIHTEKCTLFSMMHGVRKWPGMNVGVTEDDLEFLAQRDLVAKRQRRA